MTFQSAVRGAAGTTTNGWPEKTQESVKGFARGAPSLLSGPRRDSIRPRVGTPEVELPWGGLHEPGRLLAASRPRDAPAVRRGATPGRGDAPGRATHPRLRGVRPGRA